MSGNIFLMASALMLLFAPAAFGQSPIVPAGAKVEKIFDDGLTLAETAESRRGIAVYNPEGKEIAFIKIETETPTNVGWGRGADANLLYITAGQSLYRIRLSKEGYQLPARKVVTQNS